MDMCGSGRRRAALFSPMSHAFDTVSQLNNFVSRSPLKLVKKGLDRTLRPESGITPNFGLFPVTGEKMMVTDHFLHTDGPPPQ